MQCIFIRIKLRVAFNFELKKLIDIVGSYPPPFGGISIHIFRLAHILDEDKIAYRIYNHGFSTGINVVSTGKSIFWYFKYLVQRKAPLIHFHQFFTFHYLYYFLISYLTKSKIIITVHEEKMLYQNPLIRSIILFLLKHTRCYLLISVSKKLSTYWDKENINNLWLPAYIPPLSKEYIKLSSDDRRAFFMFSVWKLEPSIGEKIYNIDLAFKLLHSVQHQYKMLFLIGSKQESSAEYLRTLINQYELQDSVFVYYEKQLVDYLPNCKFILRTNNEDGYGVSLQEALDLNVPAIATDVCERPKGTIIFKKGDIDDLLSKVSNIEVNWDSSLVEKTDYHEVLLRIYKDILTDLNS